MRAIQITEFGGPEVLTLTELPDPEPGPRELLVEVTRAGINYADTHQAENSYLAPATLPMVPGSEVAGRTADGRRIVALTTGGGYAEKAVVDPNTAYDIPEGVTDEAALALVVQGATAWVLLRKSARMQPGESVVVHAAAGGVGTLAVQLARLFGAGRVIAVASSADKRDLALDLGADAVVDSAAPDMTAALIEANGGRRVDVVLDMVGGRVTDESVRALAPFGRLAFYGMASRELPSPVKLPNLMRFSTTVAGMWLPHVWMLPGDVMGQAMAEMFTLVADGDLRTVTGGVHPLAQAREAHEALRSRGTIGKLLLDPTA
ncbi:NADPH:quinone oxidoreductase family protein [Nocardiopsis sp. NPDC006139]|uniref:NADPH:quinone oxidoreductase family protein n=1 Tax=Nocardiopsis changdeensis TaxID=2831969 RepID=A0ABX8BUC6_9ACTN|nr:MULTISPECIES: NADPH:quinone oxidoreductase family protein [Nocardiopsis]QUX24697.1 NADPH:quinone oxidoreductase family protein [Nocardiopsis changdeensis]QYX35085.1 NADPH:quinone oxidoreductase family protein [Nocardiopsis sp. MT53]